MKVLVAGLDKTTIEFLRQHGIAVEEQKIEDTEELAGWIVDGMYDAGVLDLEKSKLGIYAARALRTKKITTVIVGVSKGKPDQSWPEYRAMFLENGGDDLLRAPTNPRELVASLRAAARRFVGGLLDIVEYQKGNAKLKVNLTTRSVLVNGGAIYLTPKETAMMLLFASSQGRVLSKEMILTQLYAAGVEDEPEIKIIDVFVCKLRNKLAGANPDGEHFIETVWGQGYSLPTQTVELAQSAA